MAPQSRKVLLLLDLPFLASRSTLHAAYRATLESVFNEVKSSNEIDVTRLDIAVVFSSSNILENAFKSRAACFPDLQHLFEEFYTLVCICAARTKTDLDFPGGVDARVFMLDTVSTHAKRDSLGDWALCGPLVSVGAFTASDRIYDLIYTVESKACEEVLQNVSEAMRAKDRSIPRSEKVPSGSLNIADQETTKSSNSGIVSRHTSVVVGGTFDHLHVGHKLLLTATVLLAEPDASNTSPTLRDIVVGITGDELLVNKKHAMMVESWEDRQEKAAEFIESILVFHSKIAEIRKVEHIDKPGPNGRVVRVQYGSELVIRYTKISDPFGPTITDESLTALIISKETRAGGKAVNDKRTEKGWPSCEVFEVDVLDAGSQEAESTDSTVDKQSFESKISSTEIRRRLEIKTKVPIPSNLC